FRSGELQQRVPAVVHVDGTGRPQTVRKENNPRFYELIRAFHARTGVPIILNTSLNIMGEPILETPLEAAWLLVSTGVDYCIIGERVVGKSAGFNSVLDLVPFRTQKADDMLLETRTAPTRAPADVPYPQLASSVPVLKRLDGRSSYRSIFGHDIGS